MLDREADEPAPPAASAFLDWSAFWEREHSEAEWVYPDVLARGRGHAIYAAHKLGKSLLTLWIAAQLATGEEPFAVLYLDYEMSEAELRDRLEDMGYGPGSDLSRLSYALLPDAAAARHRRGRARRSPACSTACRAPGRATTSWSSSTRSAAPSAARRTQPTPSAPSTRHTGIELKRRGCTWLRLDHAGKESSQGQRGSSAKGDDVDLVWKLVQTENGVQLQRELARMSWVPEQRHLQDQRVAARLRARRQRLAGGHRRGGLLARQVRRRPRTPPCSAAMKVLREHGAPKRKQLVLAALRFRREREEEAS